MSTRQRDADTKKYSLALAVLLILGVVAFTTATFVAHRARAHANALRSSVAVLSFAELLQQRRACELDPLTAPGSISTSSRLDPVYCREVAQAVAAQPLQLVEIPPPKSNVSAPISEPDRREDYEHDPRAIAGPGERPSTRR